MKKKMKSFAFSLAIMAAGTLSVFIYTDAKAQGEGHPFCNDNGIYAQCTTDFSTSCYAQVTGGGQFAYCPQKRHH